MKSLGIAGLPEPSSNNHYYADRIKLFLYPKRTHQFETMNPNNFPSVASSLIITALLLFATFDFGVCRVEKGMIKSQKPGGVRDITERGLNGVEIETLARFAVEEHNKKENSLLKFSRLIKAKEKVVAGKMYYLTLEATDAAGKIKVYETKVWVKPWMNFKQIQEFKEKSNLLVT